MSLLKNQQINITSSSRRRSSNSNKFNLNKSYENNSGSNNSSISSADSTPNNKFNSNEYDYKFCLNDYKSSNYIETDLLETNIKEIEFTLFRLMDNEKEAALNRNTNRLNSISNVKNKLYLGDTTTRRSRIASITKNRKNSNNNSNYSPEINASFKNGFNNTTSHNISIDSFKQQQIQSKYISKENLDPNRNNLSDSLFFDSSPYFSSPKSKYSSHGNNQCELNSISNNLPSSILNNSYSAVSINSIEHSSPRVYQKYDSFHSPKLSPSPSLYKKRNLMNNQYYGEHNFNNTEQYLNIQSENSNSNLYNSSNNIKNLTCNYNTPPESFNQNFTGNYKSDNSFQSPNQNSNDSIENFKLCNQTLNNQVNKKSVKMSVPSNKRQILEEEFRKEKYPCSEKLQKISNRLNMKYDEVQNYFKKRRREEKETNNKFSNLVKLLNNYLEQE